MDKTQFYSAEENRPITIYKVCTKNFRTNKKETLFSTPSQIQVVLYLRDFWFSMIGKEIPTDNETWNEVKKQKGIVFESKKEGKE